MIDVVYVVLAAYYTHLLKYYVIIARLRNYINLFWVHVMVFLRFWVLALSYLSFNEFECISFYGRSIIGLSWEFIVVCFRIITLQTGWRLSRLSLWFLNFIGFFPVFISASFIVLILSVLALVFISASLIILILSVVTFKYSNITWLLFSQSHWSPFVDCFLVGLWLSWWGNCYSRYVYFHVTTSIGLLVVAI